MSSQEIRSPGSVLRNRTLFYATAEAMGCAPTPYSMAKQWHQIRQWNDSLSLWKRLRRGLPLGAANQCLLFGHFPQLRQLFENPLFTLDSKVSEWDDLAETIRIGGKPLGSYYGKLSELLCDRVDWPCLPVHLVLLQTQGTRFQAHRMWLEANLVPMAGLWRLQRPISNVRHELDALLFSALFGTSPVSHVKCQSCLTRWIPVEELFDHLQHGQWLHADDQHLALLIWNFREELQRELDIGPHRLLGETKSGLPSSLRKKWCRKCAQWQDHPVQINGVCCEYAH